MSADLKYRKLTDIEHVLLRPGRYLGSVKEHKAPTWVLDLEAVRMVKKEMTWHPALQKMFDEIISNSIDESKRNKKLNKIKVYFTDTGEISVWDNGGIPVVLHREHQQYIPEMVFAELRAGSNFDDSQDSTGTGQNGEGAALVNIFSDYFIVETCDGKKWYKQTFSKNNHTKGQPEIKDVEPGTSGFTKITWLPDYARLQTTFHADNQAKLLKRVLDLAGCNPKISFELNKVPVKVESFQDYIKLYTDELVYDQNEHWQVGVGGSDGSFQHVSFVNSTETHIGGTHIQYLSDQIAYKLRDFFWKKHKVEVRPAEIKNHLTLFVNATIINPRYSSQTKDELITEVREYKTAFEVTDKFVDRITKSKIIQDVLDWVTAKEEAARLAELRKLNKENSKLDPRRIEKLCEATERLNRTACVCLFAEGDSASKAISSARDARYIASFPLKGKPVNVDAVETKKLVANEEFTNIMAILGLQLGEKATRDKLRYGKIAFATDADPDGAHITGLLINMLHRFFPELFEMGVVYRFRTPVIRVWCGKEIIEFFTEPEFIQWKDRNGSKLFRSKWLKGLGSSQTSDFCRYLKNMDKHLVPLKMEGPEDKEAIKLAFDKTRADDRKVWLDLTRPSSLDNSSHD